MDPLGMVTAISAVREHVTSAQPGAPVVPDKARHKPPSRTRTHALRRVAAAGLHRLAQKLEPQQSVCPS
ncbi:hypothetical protein Rhe02_48920 [Rhizocola hellebori]|uniref:Uncharacterized protein n=1 Tax=Rhizocola hellebori TaxID=1392758 RepID=A0A8J3QAA2_9ACTN|nr:hypothetical protein [Rhizocola hellebori]GIH06825.1 hypothetical protein Rhe02_48920 [Rhizocola hellebori]